MTQQELDKKIHLHALWLIGNSSGKQLNLSGENLAGLSFYKANLSKASLKGCHLDFSNLIEANLEEADLSSAVLKYTNLTGANLSNAKLDGADIRWCVGNNKEIKSLFLFGDHPIVYTKHIISIGCQIKTKEELVGMSDSDIESYVQEFDRKNKDGWKHYLPFLKQLILE